MLPSFRIYLTQLKKIAFKKRKLLPSIGNVKTLNSSAHLSEHL